MTKTHENLNAVSSVVLFVLLVLLLFQSQFEQKSPN